ncbi:MAG: FkbM family methyltransferase [Nitrososphaeraceae archaeon]
MQTEKLTSWLTRQEPMNVVPVLDKVLVFLHKIMYLVFYLVSRFSLRIVLGRKRRDRVFFKKGINFRYEYNAIPSLFIIKFLYAVVKFLRLANNNNPLLLKISVSKYDYKAYCPINKDDIINMTIREDEIIEHFHTKTGHVIVDIGAHIGRYSIISSKRVGSRGKVIAIEAHPHNFEILKRNIKLNKLTNVIALNSAVYSKETKIKLYTPGQQLGHTIYNTILSDRAKKEDRFVEINSNTLDNLLQQNGINHADINWIKIDVEGAEFEVLKGATNVLSKSKDIALLIEVHNLHGGTNLYRQIVEFLNVYNFKIEFEKTHNGGERHIVVRKQL